MIGAIAGDIVGSKYEFNNIKTKDFPLFSEGCMLTDDTVMTVAVARALMISRKEGRNFREVLVPQMQQLGRKYPSSYGSHFSFWLYSDPPLPYNSFGNGSAMRASPCGYMAVTPEEALSLAEASADVTHDHPEGIKGARAAAGAVFLARTGSSKEEIRSFIENGYYSLDFTLDGIRPGYTFNETCQETVPQAIRAFLESTDFEDALRCAVSLGGDSDTLAAITGSIAWAYYAREWRDLPKDQWPDRERKIYDSCLAYLPNEFKETIDSFETEWKARNEEFRQTGSCGEIPHRKTAPAPTVPDQPEPEKRKGISGLLSVFKRKKRSGEDIE